MIDHIYLSGKSEGHSLQYRSTLFHKAVPERSCMKWMWSGLTFRKSNVNHMLGIL